VQSTGEQQCGKSVQDDVMKCSFQV